MALGIIGSWGLYQQFKTIFKKKSAKSISGIWVITFLAMFTSFLIYGWQQESIPMQFQGWLRVGFSIPVVVGFFLYGSPNQKDLWVLLLCTTLLTMMLFLKKFSPTIFSLFSFLGIISSFLQASTIKRHRTRGQVSVTLQVIYLASVLCWLIYAIFRKDYYLIIVSIGFIFSYSSTIIMWVRYPNNIEAN